MKSSRRNGCHYVVAVVIFVWSGTSEVPSVLSSLSFLSSCGRINDIKLDSSSSLTFSHSAYCAGTDIEKRMIIRRCRLSTKGHRHLGCSWRQCWGYGSKSGDVLYQYYEYFFRSFPITYFEIGKGSRSVVCVSLISPCPYHVYDDDYNVEETDGDLFLVALRNLVDKRRLWEMCRKSVFMKGMWLLRSMRFAIFGVLHDRGLLFKRRVEDAVDAIGRMRFEQHAWAHSEFLASIAERYCPGLTEFYKLVRGT